MTSLPPFDAETTITFVADRGHTQALGVRYVGHGADWVELGMDYDPRLIGNPATGVIASGPIVTLMDMAASMAIWVRREGYLPQATLDLRVDYLRPATPGHAVIGRGECYRMTRQIAFVRGEAHNGDPDDPIAHVAGTFMFLDS